MIGASFWSHSTETAPLTPETFREGVVRLEELDRLDRQRRPMYETEPHHPRCVAVRTNNWRDCSCSTGGWLASHGYFTDRYARLVNELFRRYDAVRDHFAALDRDDD